MDGVLVSLISTLLFSLSHSPRLGSDMSTDPATLSLDVLPEPVGRFHLLSEPHWLPGPRLDGLNSARMDFPAGTRVKRGDLSYFSGSRYRPRNAHHFGPLGKMVFFLDVLSV
jgi:hypothetical protein